MPVPTVGITSQLPHIFLLGQAYLRIFLNTALQAALATDQWVLTCKRNITAHPCPRPEGPSVRSRVSSGCVVVGKGCVANLDQWGNHRFGVRKGNILEEPRFFSNYFPKKYTHSMI